MMVGGKNKDAVSFEERADELDALAKKEAEEAEEAKKNRNFYMVFKSGGSQALRALMKESPLAAQLFLYFAENIDRSNAIVATGRVLGEALKTHESNISKAIKVLIERNYVLRLKTGSSNIFVLNPDIVWNSWATGKSRCWFDNVKVLLSKNDQPASVRKQMAMLIQKFDGTAPIQGELFPGEMD